VGTRAGRLHFQKTKLRDGRKGLAVKLTICKL
jgi:hypothetical protein